MLADGWSFILWFVLYLEVRLGCLDTRSSHFIGMALNIKLALLSLQMWLSMPSSCIVMQQALNAIMTILTIVAPSGNKLKAYCCCVSPIFCDQRINQYLHSCNIDHVYDTTL